MRADISFLSKKELPQSHTSAVRMTGSCPSSSPHATNHPTQADLLLQRVFVGKGLTVRLAFSPAPVAGNSWWVLYSAGELSSRKKFLANTQPAWDKKRWVNSGNRFHEQTGETMAAQQEQKGDPLPLNSSPQKTQLKRKKVHSLLGIQ